MAGIPGEEVSMVITTIIDNSSYVGGTIENSSYVGGPHRGEKYKTARKTSLDAHCHDPCYYFFADYLPEKEGS